VVKENWEHRSPLVEIRPDALDRMLTSAFPRHTANAISLLAGGLANANYRIALSGTAAPVVLRVYLRDPSACDREAALLRLVRDRVPVPEVLHAGIDEPTDHHFMVLTWVDGISLNDLIRAGATADVLAGVRSAGRALAALRHFHFPRAGFLDASLNVAEPFPPGPRSFIGLVAQLLDGGAAQHLGPRLAASVRTFVAESAGLLAAVQHEAVLVHSDFNPPNVLVRTNGATTVSAVLDWEFAHAGASLADIGNMLRHARTMPPGFRAEFIAGYLEGGGTLPEGWERIAALADLPALLDFLCSDRPGATMLRDVRDLVESTVTTWGDA
jgi:aminoglycoside phosphotransferase (APT) family kinase protein